MRSRSSELPAFARSSPQRSLLPWRVGSFENIAPVGRSPRSPTDSISTAFLPPKAESSGTPGQCERPCCDWPEPNDESAANSAFFSLAALFRVGCTYVAHDVSCLSARIQGSGARAHDRVAHDVRSVQGKTLFRSCLRLLTVGNHGSSAVLPSHRTWLPETERRVEWLVLNLLRSLTVQFRARC
jgi:hypothetical protein